MCCIPMAAVQGRSRPERPVKISTDRSIAPGLQRVLLAVPLARMEGSTLTRHGAGAGVLHPDGCCPGQESPCVARGVPGGKASAVPPSGILWPSLWLRWRAGPPPWCRSVRVDPHRCAHFGHRMKGMGRPAWSWPGVSCWSWPRGSAPPHPCHTHLDSPIGENFSHARGHAVFRLCLQNFLRMGEGYTIALDGGKMVEPTTALT